MNETATPPAEQEPGFLSSEFQARLRALEFALRRALPSNLRGDRRSPSRKGISLEFADFRAYVPGDDVRHLDWATYARLDQLIVKLYHDEEDVQLHLLVDDSRSMLYGKPRKSRRAREIAAALAWIGLSHAQRVSLTLLGDSLAGVPLCQGSGSIPRLLELLEQPEGGGTRAIHESCGEFMGRARPRGAIVLISDLMDRAGPGEILRKLQTTVTEVTFLQVLAPAEVEPDLEGDLRLIDMESEQKVEVNLTPAVLEAYRARVRSFIAHCAESVRRREGAFAQTTSGDSLEEFLLGALVREGILR